MEDGKVMSKLNVLYEDNHIIVVEKPINILSQSDITGDDDLLTMVKNYLKEKYKKPGNVYLGLVHRLDRPVGGIMVFAKTSKAASRLSLQIKNNEFHKKYLAVVHGIIDEDEQEFEDYIKKLDNGNSIITSEDDGKYSKLNYKVLKRNLRNNMTFVEIELITGRHHQIRVQFASRGHYLCGDQRYGVSDKTQIALFAYYLSFVHPTTKERLEFKLYPTNYEYFKVFLM